MAILNIISAVLLLLLAGHAVTRALEHSSTKLFFKTIALILIALFFMVANVGME